MADINIKTLIYLIQKLTDNGYDIPEEFKDDQLNEDKFNYFLENPDIIFKPIKNTHSEIASPNGLMIHFIVENDKNQIGIEHINIMVTRILSAQGDSKVSTVILVVNKTISSYAKKKIKELKSNRTVRIVVYTSDELSFNITKHKKIPKHELMSKAAAEKWLSESGVVKAHMPRILSSDPYCKWLDARTGDIIKVTSPSPTSTTFIRHLVVFQG